MSGALVRIPPNQWIHLMDRNTLISRLLLGPLQYASQLHEDVVAGPSPLVVLPPNTYVIVANPVVRDRNGAVALDALGVASLQHGLDEVRLAPLDPFPLFPGELLQCQPTALPHVDVNAALLLCARRDCVDRAGVRRKAGDEWLFAGPALYSPMAEVEIKERRTAIIIGPNEALHVRAVTDCLDHQQQQRKAGEHWLIRTAGAYMLPVCEEDVELCTAFVLTDTDALLVRANVTFTAIDGKVRVAGDQYLITSADTATFIPDVHESVVAQQPLVSLSRRQYCIVQNPVDPATGRAQLGKTEVRRGELSFFLKPDEALVGGGVYDVIVLGAHEMLSVRCMLPFDDNGVARHAGEKIYVRGPCEFVPRVEVRVEKALRAAISIDAFDYHFLFRPTVSNRMFTVTPVNAQPKAVAATAGKKGAQVRKAKN
jgi:major vault protein